MIYYYSSSLLVYTSILIIILLFLSASLPMTTISARSTGPPLISQQRKLPKSLSEIPSKNHHTEFGHANFRFALFIPDDEMDVVETTTSTFASTSTSSSTSATSSTTTTSATTTVLVTTEAPPTTSTVENQTATLISSNESSTMTTSSMEESTTSTSSTTLSTTTSTTTIPSSTTATINGNETNITTSGLPPLPLVAPSPPSPTFKFSSFYQVVILTSSRMLSYRLSQFLDTVRASSSSTSFSASQTPLWQIGSITQRAYQDGSAQNARLSDPTAATILYSVSSTVRPKRFPYPPFRGVLWTEKASCAIRFMNFANIGQLKTQPMLVRTVAGQAGNCGALSTTSETRATSIKMTAPSGLSPEMTSGGLVFVTDDTCLRVLYNFDKFLESDEQFNSNDVSPNAISAENTVKMETFAGDCASGGASEGNVIDFARFYQLEGVVFDQGESVLILAQRFGLLRKIWPMPRTYEDFVSMKKYAFSSTISSALLPGTIHQVLWTNPSSKYPQFHDSSIMIVSGDDSEVAPSVTVETNATNTDAIGEDPLFLGIHEVPLFRPTEFNAKSILMFPNGSALAFQANSLDQTTSSFLFLEKHSSAITNKDDELFFDFNGPEQYFPGRPSLSSSVSLSLEPTITHEETISPTVSPTYPTMPKTPSVTAHRTYSARGTTESLSLSDPSPSDPSESPPTPSQTDTEHIVTDSETDTIYFFRPRSIIPREVMRVYIIQTSLALGFVSGVAGSSPPSAMIATRLVNAFDSCDCPTLPVTKIDDTLKYFTGLTFGVSDEFMVPIASIDNKLRRDDQKHDYDDEVRNLLLNENVIPRIRAVIVMHLITSVVIAPPVLFGLRVVDGFIATDGMPAAFRLGLIAVVVSVWLQGALAASVALVLLSPDPTMEAVILIIPHLLFCFLVVIVVPSRLTYNALNVEPKPHLEEIYYDDALSAEELAELDKKKDKQREKERKKREKEEHEKRVYMEDEFDDDVVKKNQKKKEDEEAKKKQENTGNNDNSNNASKDNSGQEDSSPSAKKKKSTEDNKTHEERSTRKIGVWEKFTRWCRGPVHWQPPYSESFPRSFPLVSPLIASSPTSFKGWLFIVHVFVSIGLGIIDGYRISKALTNSAFSMACTWYLEMAAALIVGLLALTVLILQIKYRNFKSPTSGAFISPPVTLGHFLAVFFNAGAKCLQVACSFAQDLWYVKSDDFTPNLDEFRSKLVSAADLCVLIATFGLFCTCVPFLVRCGQILGSKMTGCAVNIQESATQSHRLSMLSLKKKDSQRNSGNDGGEPLLTNEDLAMHLSPERGQLWKMLDKMEKKRISKPEHLDLLRRPLTTDEQEMKSFRRKAMFAGLIQESDDDDDDDDDGGRNNNKYHNANDERDDEIMLEGASVHNNDAGKMDALERYALVLRTERIADWKREQKFLRAQAKAEMERKQREEERKREEERLAREFLEKEAAEGDGSFIVDLL